MSIPVWKRGDWAAFFGLFSNNLTNLLTVIALLTFVVGMPADIVFGQVAPAFGLAVFIASCCYVFFAIRLAKATGRKDVVALPSGPSAPSVFTVTFLVLLPVYQLTQDHMFALKVGLVWGFVEGAILFAGSFMGDLLRRIVPRTELLSCLAGLGLLLLAMNPMLQSFQTPVVAFVVLGLIFLNWFGRNPIFKKVPTGLLLLLVGSALAWIFGLQDPAQISKKEGYKVETEDSNQQPVYRANNDNCQCSVIEPFHAISSFNTRLHGGKYPCGLWTLLLCSTRNIAIVVSHVNR